MKNLLTSSILFLAAFITATAQMVNPNKPFTTLSSDPGYLSRTEIVVGIGLGERVIDYARNFAGLTETVGYQFTKNIVAGVGTGVLVYNGGTLVPLFIDVRYMFNAKQVTPYIFAHGGTLLMFSNFQSSKIFLSGGGGAQYAFSSRIAAHLGAGLMLQSQTTRDSFITLRGGFTYMF